MQATWHYRSWLLIYAMGAMAVIKFIDLDDNWATEVGKKAMYDAAKSRSFRVDLGAWR